MALDDKFDDIKKLIDVGKEKGYLTYDEVNDLIPHDVHSPDDLDDLITTPGHSKKPTTRSACICARWAPFRCSPVKAK